MHKLLYYIAFLSIAVGSARSAEPRDNGGLDPSKEMYQYSHRVWMKKDGLPQNSVHTIIQTRDGYLWFGTDEGLARFDGLQFHVFNVRNTPQFASNQVRSLCEASDGTLWIGFIDGGIVARRAERFTAFAPQKKFSRLSVWTMCEDRSHRMWFATLDGVLRFDPKDSSSTFFTEKDGLPIRVVPSIVEDTSGTILVGTRYGISMYRDGRFVPYASVKTPAHALFRDHSGAVWFSASKAGLARINGDSSVTTFNIFTASMEMPVNQIYQDRAGTLWISTAGQGVFRGINGHFTNFAREDGLSSSFAEAIYEDREGNLWIGTTAGGLNRLSNTKFTTYIPSVGASMVWSVYQDPSGRIWAGNESGMLLTLEHGKLVPAFSDSVLKSGAVMSILVDKKGLLWIGSHSGLYQITRWKNKRALTKSDFTYHDIGMVNAIIEDRRGVLWFGAARGLVRYDRGIFTTFAKQNGVTISDIRVLHEDRRGDLWLCMSNGGVVRMHDTVFTSYAGAQYPGAPDHVMSMCEDSSGTLWFGTLAGGLARWNGLKFSTVRYAQNIFDESIFSIQDDHRGNLWMSSNNGVFRVSKAELNDACDGKLPAVHGTVYGMSDGMKSDECNGGFLNSALTTKDGAMWFPTTIGLVRVNPAALPRNEVPPSVVLESFSADKKKIALEPEIAIDPGAGMLEFTYAGLSFMASDRVRFRVLLEGFDKEWTDVGSRRYVSYTNIPPGRYRFRVIAANNDGVWNETGAMLAFTLRPHFYQTVWFYIFVVVLIALSGAVAHKFYRRRKDRALIQSRRQAQLEVRLKESQLNSLSMQLQPHFLFNTLNSISSLMHFDVDKADQMVAHLGDLLRMSLGRVKHQEVPLKQELEFLESYLCIEQARLDNRLRVVRRIDPETLPALVPSMLWQPLVENAIKHGIAPRKTPGTLTLGARRVGSELELTIRDDGEGMERAVTPGASNGVGLRNTKERLELLYPHRHEIRFTNNPEGGVTVTLRIPFRIEEYETHERT